MVAVISQIIQCRDVRKSSDGGTYYMIHFRGNNGNVADDRMICILETILEEEKRRANTSTYA